MKTLLQLLCRRFLLAPLAGVIAVGETAPLMAPASTLGAAAITATAFALAPRAEALPADRIAGRQGARDSRQQGRQTSRARRRGCYALPPGAALYPYGAYRYYRVGPRFYYPYMYGGRTVYVDIDVVGGYPAPPPPAGSIDIDIYVR